MLQRFSGAVTPWLRPLVAAGKRANRSSLRRSEQLRELFLGQTGLANQGAEGAFGEFAMVGNGEAATRRMAQNDVAARLMIHRVTDSAKDFDSSAPEQMGRWLMRGLQRWLP